MQAITITKANDPAAAWIREGLFKGEIRRQNAENERLKAECAAYKRRLNRAQAARMAEYRETIEADKRSKAPTIWGVVRLVTLFLAGAGCAGMCALIAMMGRL